MSQGLKLVAGAGFVPRHGGNLIRSSHFSTLIVRTPSLPKRTALLQFGVRFGVRSADGSCGPNIAPSGWKLINRRVPVGLGRSSWGSKRRKQNQCPACLGAGEAWVGFKADVTWRISAMNRTWRSERRMRRWLRWAGSITAACSVEALSLFENAGAEHCGRNPQGAGTAFHLD
jgi:hypothetical protein